ncbi:hypothetical protein F5X99DRAFT_366738 [Biscogniauxia marginata]|nr:hypothetical protein F5X99DRAFT_366738 [Biscogniauxia marginata]
MGYSKLALGILKKSLAKRTVFRQRSASDVPISNDNAITAFSHDDVYGIDRDVYREMKWKKCSPQCFTIVKDHQAEALRLLKNLAKSNPAMLAALQISLERSLDNCEVMHWPYDNRQFKDVVMATICRFIKEAAKLNIFADPVRLQTVPCRVEVWECMKEIIILSKESDTSYPSDVLRMAGAFLHSSLWSFTNIWRYGDEKQDLVAARQTWTGYFFNYKNQETCGCKNGLRYTSVLASHQKTLGAGGRHLCESEDRSRPSPLCREIVLTEDELTVAMDPMRHPGEPCSGETYHDNSCLGSGIMHLGRDHAI